MLTPDESSALFQIAIGIGKVATILGVLAVIHVIRG